MWTDNCAGPVRSDQVVFALRTPSGFAGLLDSGQQEGDKDRDDRDDDEQFDQCERPAGSCSCHVNTPVIRGFVYAIRSAAGFSAGHCLYQADPADERGGRRLQAEGFFPVHCTHRLATRMPVPRDGASAIAAEVP